MADKKPRKPFDDPERIAEVAEQRRRLRANYAAQRERRQQHKRKARALCAEVARELVAAGWSDVEVAPMGSIMSISGKDPSGLAHGRAIAGREELKAFRSSLKPSARPGGLRQASAGAGLYADAPDPNTAELEALRKRIAELEKRASAPAPVTAAEPPPPPPPAAEPPPPPPAAEPPPPPASASAELPAPLARLVPPNLELEAQKAWLGSRWIQLNAKRLDMAKREADRSLEDLTAADRAELAQLDAFQSWFS